MKTLAQFKQENDIKAIELLQGTGRKYAQVRDLQLVVSKECDLTKPLFVVPMRQPNDPDSPKDLQLNDDNSHVVVGVHILVNSTVKVVETI